MLIDRKEEMISDLKSRLSEERFEHSLGVARVARELAEKWNADPLKAEIAGLLHDYEKETDIEVLREMTSELFKDEVFVDSILHGFVAAITLKNIYGIEDEDILNAISYHTTGRANMSKLEKVIFVADLIDDTRSYDDVDRIRELAFADLDEAVYEKLDFAISKCERLERVIHSLTLEAKEYIILKLNENENRRK